MWPKKTSIFEVGPRDGLQSEAKILNLDQRAGLIDALALSGLKRIEVGSFVRSDRIPQLQNTDDLMKRLHSVKQRFSDVEFWTFIPNEVGFERAAAAGADGVSYFVAASETFCQKNVNRSQSEILAELAKILPKAKKAKIATRVYLSTLVFCPYEGATPPAAVERLVQKLRHLDVNEIVLSDTTGHANPLSLRKLLGRILKKVPVKNFALHLHDTRGLALANIMEGLEHGIQIFDSSVGGMGGCPYAPGATGNLSTEDLANLLASLGVIKNVDIGQLAKAGALAEKFLNKELPSKVLRTLEKKYVATSS